MRQVTFFEGVLRHHYRRMLETVVAYRYVTIAVAVAGLIVVGGLIGGGKVPIVFFQKMDAETLLAELELPIGSPLDRTDAVMRRIEAATADIPEINTRYSLIGSQMNISGDGLGTTSRTPGR